MATQALGVFALPGHGRRARAGAARRLRHRDRGQVGQPGPRPGGCRADAQRRLPDADGRGRPHAGPTSLAPLLGDDEFAEATVAAASNAKLTPAAPGWADGRGLTGPGGPVRRHRPAAATSRSSPRRPTSRSTASSTAERARSRPPVAAAPASAAAPVRSPRDNHTGIRRGGPDEQHAQRHGPATPPDPHRSAAPAQRAAGCRYGSWCPAVARARRSTRLPAGRQVVLSLPGVRPGPAVRPSRRSGSGSTTTARSSPTRYLWRVAARAPSSSASSTRRSRW